MCNTHKNNTTSFDKMSTADGLIINFRRNIYKLWLL